MNIIGKTYEPKDFEQRIYDNWIAKRYFEANNKSDKTPFTIMMGTILDNNNKKSMQGLLW